ncbi:MAG: hypothetical protein GY707_18515, partial [Desulfobacteraceae bacterium]|nr:hypothetical protein [Desulfobacteraceae bacterium]
GMPEDVRNSILSDVKTDQGIDLNILIKNFKEFEKKSFASQEFFKADSNHNNVVKLLDQLNLGNTSKSFIDGKLSLQEFINILENKRRAVLEASTDSNSKENLLASSAKILKSKAEQNSPLTISNFSSVNTGEENKFSDLVDNLFKNVSKKEGTNDKIVNVPLDKFSNKDFEKLFPFSFKTENQKDFQTAIKSELEEKFTKLLGKLATDMSGKNDSESKNPFQEGKKQTNALNMSDSNNSASGEGKLLNGARYLSSAKKGQASTLPSYVTNQIGRSIVRAVNQGQNEIRIQLKPPELGRMMITIEELGNGVKVSIVAENQTARDMLLSNSNNLKTALEGSGISLENFDVEMGSDFNQSMRDAKNQAGYSKNKKDQNNEAVDGKNIKVGREALLQEKHLTHDGVLYYVA